MNEQQLRQSVVSVMQGWVGYSEKNGKFKAIIDLYNTQNPLPVGYKVKYTDEWCATTVTAAGMKAGLQDIIFGECSCSRMIALYKDAGRWQESDAYRPDPGDIIMYDWQDTGSGDNTGAPDHVGIVEKVVGNTITVIEGNKGEAVARRTLAVNGKFIRGYCLPDYAGKAKNQTEEEDDDMNVEKLTEDELLRLAERIQAALGKRAIGATLAPELEEAKALGITDGSNPNAFCTRAQAAVMVKRGLKQKGV